MTQAVAPENGLEPRWVVGRHRPVAITHRMDGCVDAALCSARRYSSDTESWASSSVSSLWYIRSTTSVLDYFVVSLPTSPPPSLASVYLQTEP